MVSETETNKGITEMLDGCGGLEYEFYYTEPNGIRMRYSVKIKKTEVKLQKLKK